MWYTFEAMQLPKLPEVVVKDRHVVVDMNLRLCAVKKLINLPCGEKICGLNVKKFELFFKYLNIQSTGRGGKGAAARPKPGSGEIRRKKGGKIPKNRF
ncbi:hypothetical protein OUZ56_010384 [Daphnia magna]|uniref:Uncharacterized protein n=1 Tax=Daphnia magna TaxID=35525 RepID=A0ABR0AID7_9CRUS|nr:hypothetical protein OUZ56_010384 [Daphnia magna]